MQMPTSWSEFINALSKAEIPFIENEKQDHKCNEITLVGDATLISKDPMNSYLNLTVPIEIDINNSFSSLVSQVYLRKICIIIVLNLFFFSFIVIRKIQSCCGRIY